MQEQNKNEYKLLGLNIAYYRKARCLSQNELAEKVNISKTHMSRIETAECVISLDVVFDICRTLNISIKDIFDFRIIT